MALLYKCTKKEVDCAIVNQPNIEYTHYNIRILGTHIIKHSVTPNIHKGG